MEFEECARQLEALDPTLAQEVSDWIELLIALEEAEAPFTPDFEAACVFTGVALRKDPNNGPGVLKVNKIEPRGYDDWNKAVQTPGGPCEGKTPLECYKDKIEAYKKRACGEVDENGNPTGKTPKLESLPEPCRSICEAIRGGWVDFPAPECKRLGHAGVTTRAPGTVAGKPGTRSRVRIDWKTLLLSAGSYGTFKHEMDHVVWLASRADALKPITDQKEAKRKAAKAKLKASEEAKANGNFVQALALIKEALALAKEVQALCEEEVRKALDEIILREARALEQGVLHASEWVKGSPVSTAADGDVQELVDIKTTLFMFAKQLNSHLSEPPFGKVTPGKDAQTKVCDRVKNVKAHAKKEQAPLLGQSVWDCAKKVLPDLEKEFDKLEKRLGC